MIKQAFTWHINILITLSILLLLAFMGVSGAVEQSGKSLYNFLSPKEASQDIIVVELDSKSIKKIGQWPWPRQIHADLITELSEKEATQIAFDIDFSAQSNKLSDQAMAGAIKASDATVILATFKQRKSENSANFTENLPLPIFADHALLGSVNVIPDQAGYISNYQYAQKIGDRIRPNIAALMTNTAGDLNKSFEIDQSINPATIPRISAIDIIEKRIDRADIKGKSIIIGGTAVELGDRYATPAHGVIPGVVIHALAAETIKSGMDIAILSGYIPFAAMLIMTLLLTKILKPRTRAFKLSMVALILSTILIKFIAYHHAIFSIEMGLTLSFLTTHLIVTFIISALHSLHSERMFDRDTQLPSNLLMIDKSRKMTQLNIAVAQINNFAEIKAVYTKEELSQILQSLARRLELLAVSNSIYRTASDQLAWFVDPQYDDRLQDHFDTASSFLLHPIIVGPHMIKLNVNCGYVDGPSDECAELLSKASSAATRAAILGYRWTPYNDDINIFAKEKLTLLSSLDDALAHDDIWPAYQPKIDVQTGLITSAEALARWTHGELGNIGPDRFIPLLEAQGLMTDLTYHILRLSLRDIERWNLQGSDFNCSVNVSAALLLDQKFIQKSIDLINDSPVDNGQITIEITETSALENMEKASKMLTEISAHGIKLSIDDYGTGQSTLSYLRNFAAHEIKIDQSFIKSMVENETDRMMVRSTIDLAHSMNFKVVAEGVEDQATYDILKTFNCDVIQGWHIGRPIGADEFAKTWLNGDLRRQRHIAHNGQAAKLNAA